jgi:hypothetical protein
MGGYGYHSQQSVRSGGSLSIQEKGQGLALFLPHTSIDNHSPIAYSHTQLLCSSSLADADLPAHVIACYATVRHNNEVLLFYNPLVGR